MRGEHALPRCGPVFVPQSAVPDELAQVAQVVVLRRHGMAHAVEARGTGLENRRVPVLHSQVEQAQHREALLIAASSTEVPAGSG